MEDQVIANIEEQISDLDRKETELTWELLDVFTDVYAVTPEDNPENDQNDQEENIDQFKASILGAQAVPTQPCEYAGRYQDPLYVQEVLQKLENMKNLVRQSNLENVNENPVYLRELARVEATYPDNGGRTMLNELVAVYIFLGGN